MKSRLHLGLLALALMVFAGIGVRCGSRLLDQTLAVLILGVYTVGSAVLVLKSLGSPPRERRKIFSCGELALLPESWRRWLLDEKLPPAP